MSAGYPSMGKGRPVMEYFHEGGPGQVVDLNTAEKLLRMMLERMGNLRRVLLVPPDYTRLHSGAGELTVLLYRLLKDRGHVEVLPALGTHAPMTPEEIRSMFPGLPPGLFRVHQWRKDLKRLGEVPAEYVRKVSAGKVNYPIYCEVNQSLLEEHWDRIISIGQLVPHEVIGIANHNKNVYVGTGGRDTINKTHYLGAICNMETLMGRIHTPVRDVLNYMDEAFATELPLSYLLTVRSRDDQGKLVTRGLYAGDDEACFLRGARLCQEVNLSLFDKPLRKVVVYLDPEEFRSTWLGNKAIYRTRMAMADGGRLIILAPGVRQFGEDRQIDQLIREFGYRGIEKTREFVQEHQHLRDNLSAAAHLIHGSSEGRFSITYCPGVLDREEIEKAGYDYADVDEMMNRYHPETLSEGFNTLPGGEEIFFISQPALGLWGLKTQFEQGNQTSAKEV
jgi:nickel-dependent lactate racemase